uniref:Gelsolin-like domain-containing protein n=1 Tax=Pygocentrus nattereri TaxID=42514 RepID=A0AAR2JTA7_PYGNA
EYVSAPESSGGMLYTTPSHAWHCNMKMVPVPEQAFGNFFEGDCYIVLHGSHDSSHSMDIHYWIGNVSSQDEQGAAAIYVTQLDEYLGGSPVQHREVQGCESQKFKGYFKNGIIYKKGGVASGFKHIETNVYNILRLLHVKGRKNVTATEVEVSWKSFNTGDVFLLDMGKTIVQWNGPQSNRRERLKGCMLAQDIRDRERGGRAQIGVVEGDREEASAELMKMMTSVLGQRSGALRDAVPDDTPDQLQIDNVKLYQVSDASGQLMVQEVASNPLTQDLLHSDDCYIVDVGGVSLSVWKGKKATLQERRSAMERAVGFIKAKNYPPTTHVEVMSEGGESALFKQLFKSWTEPGLTQGLGTTYTRGKIAKVDHVKFDVMELHAEPKLAAHERMVDDASGEVEIWRIENLELQEVPRNTYGQFYGGDCYLVLYTYNRANKPEYILYINTPPNPDISEAEISPHCQLNPDTGAKLFQVRGTNEINTKTTEVPARASSLNSNDVFLLKTDQVTYMWYGKVVGDVLSKQDKQIVMEGQEPPQFWVALGGKAPYAQDKRLEKEVPLHSPRLFECSNQTGQFRMTEVAQFTQDDLDEDDVMLLDTWEELFLWIGNSANQDETQEAYTSTVQYLKTHPAGRDPETSIISVKQGYEPPTFTGWFNAWDSHKWSVSLSYEEMKSKLGDSASATQITMVCGPFIYLVQ